MTQVSSKNYSQYLMQRVCAILNWGVKAPVGLTSAVPSAAVQFVTVVAHAAEHPRKVLAGSEHTDVLEVALVDVCGEKGQSDSIMREGNRKRVETRIDECVGVSIIIAEDNVDVSFWVNRRDQSENLANRDKV